MAGFVAALGLTVALFVASEAFADPTLLGQGKMGALFSGFVGLTAVLIGRALGMSKPPPEPVRPTPPLTTAGTPAPQPTSISAAPRD